MIRATARAFLAFFALLSCGLALAAVGRTPGVPAVSVSGEGSYTIPLNLPPGRSGIQPELVLVYSHRAGNGLLGMGWSIAGLSAITRCTATVAQDDWAGPITGTPSDELCLDGNKLRLLEDEAEDIYGTEIEAFSKIVATGTPPTKFVQYRRNGLIYTYGGTADSQIDFGGTTSIWALSEVRDRSGNYMTLTYHEDSTSYRPNQITYAAHEQGTLATHSVVFHYEPGRPDSLRGYYAGRLTNQTQRMQEIEISYGGSAARTYSFEYETGTPTGRSRLISITECGRSGGCYAPTTFQYDDGIAGWDNALSGPAISTMEHAIAGDFNGDGREDVAFFDVGLDAWQVAFAPASGGFPAATNTGKGKAVHYTQAVPIDLNADGLLDLLVPDGANPNWYWLHKTGPTSWAFDDTTRAATGAGDGKVKAIDVDGDGCQDLVYASSATQLSWRKNNCNGTKTSLASTSAVVWTTPSGYSLAPQPFASLAQTYKQLQRAADFNGDGRGDLVVALTQETSGPPEWLDQLSGDCFPPGMQNCEFCSCIVDRCTSNPPPNPCTLGDVCNGVSGWEWTQYFCEEGVEISYRYEALFGNGTSFLTGALNLTSSAPLLVSIADFNGDGLTDIYYYSGTWKLRFSKGGTNSFDAVVNTGQSSSDSSKVLSTDWDGDGRADLLAAEGGFWNYLRSNGANLLAPTPVDPALPATGAAEYPKVLDVDGKSLPDLFFVDAGTSKRRLHAGSLKQDLLRTATDGFDNASTFTYASLANTTVYTKGPIGPAAAYPMQEYAGPFKVVKQYATSNGLRGSYTMKYAYAGARLALNGRGFVGFAKRTVTDSRTGNYTVETYEQDAVQHWERLGALLTSTTRTDPASEAGDPQDALLQEIVNTWNAVERSEPEYDEVCRQPYVSTRVVKNYEINALTPSVALVSTVTTVVETDEAHFGVPTYVSVKTEEPTLTTGTHPGAYKLEEIVNTIPPNDPTEEANWCVGKPTRVEVTNSLDVNGSLSSVTRTVDRTWDYVHCRLEQEVVEPDDSLVRVTTDYSYDDFGNVGQVEVTPNNHVPEGQTVATRTTVINWGSGGGTDQDVDGRFPTSVTNAEGHKTTQTWDLRFGLPDIQTDPNSLATNFDYDEFGRVSKESRPDGTALERSYLACDADCTGMASHPEYSEYKLRTRLKRGSTVLSDSFTIQDSFDRVHRATRYVLGGAKSDVLIEYQKAGWLSRESQPFFNGTGTPIWTTRAYDAAGRVKRITRGQTNDEITGAAITSYGYLGLTTTRTVQTDTDRVTTSVAYAWGEAASITDARNVAVEYAYDPFGNLALTRDAQGNEFTAAYNQRGFKIESNDPDVGHWEFDYYPLGELKTQTDAKGQVTSFKYDALSRLVERTESDGADVTTWAWGSSPAQKDVGKLDQVQLGEVTQNYSYDSFGRVGNLTTTIGAGSYPIGYTYDDSATGFLRTIEYPNSTGARLKVRYEYDTGTGRGATLDTVVDDATGLPFWEATATDAFGQYQHVTLGGSLDTLTSFDSITGFVNAIASGPTGTTSLQDLSYSWTKTGALRLRQDHNQQDGSGDLQENFYYDELDRLIESKLQGATNLTVTYDDIGNITSKQVTGTESYDYTTVQSSCDDIDAYYDHEQPHAVRYAKNSPYCYDENGNMIRRGGTTIDWSSYNLPTRINKPGGGANHYSKFWYGPDRQRYRQENKDGASIETTIYVGGLFEQVTGGATTTYKHHIVAGNRTVAIHARQSSPTSSDTFYLLYDHLGSVDKIVANVGGDWTVLASLSYDAFGRRRNEDWTVGSPSDLSVLDDTTHRGFTFHEHLDDLSLIHMKGRVYDPALARFLSADPFVQDAFDGQNLNRFSYVVNNPLSLVDPTGFAIDEPRCGNTEGGGGNAGGGGRGGVPPNDRPPGLPGDPEEPRDPRPPTEPPPGPTPPGPQPDPDPAPGGEMRLTGLLEDALASDPIASDITAQAEDAAANRSPTGLNYPIDLPNYVLALSPEDLGNIDAVAVALAVVNAAMVASGNAEAIAVFLTVRVSYDPQGLGYNRVATAGGGAIAFSPLVSRYANSGWKIEENYYGLAISRGGPGAVATVLAHEFGHLVLVSPGTSQGTLERTANSYVAQLYPFMAEFVSLRGIELDQ